MTAENTHNQSSSESSKLLPYHASVFRIAANEAEIVASSVYNEKFNSMVYQDMEDISARFNQFVEETQKRWESKTTSYTPPTLKRDIDRIRMIAEQLKDHLGMYGSNEVDNIAETFQGSLGKIQNLLRRAVTYPKQPQLSTTSVTPRRLDRLAPPTLERIPEMYGASDWADEELLLRRARGQMGHEFVHGEASTTLLEGEGLVGSSCEGILNQNLSVKNDRESETSSVLADFIYTGATTSVTNRAAKVGQTYTSGLHHDNVQPLDVESGKEQHPNPTQNSLVSRHSMLIIYKSSLAVFSILVPVLAITLAVLTFIPLFIETAQLGPEWESVLTKYQFTKDMLRNWGPAGLLIVSIFREQSNALDQCNLKTFVGLLTLFLVLNGCSIVLEAIGRSLYAIMAVDLSDILLLLTTFFYFEWVLRRQ